MKQALREKKRKTRSTPEWKELREFIKQRQGGKDIFTGKPLRRGWAVHHRYFRNGAEERYDDLNPDRFLGLNRETHTVLHFLARYSNYDYICSSIAQELKETEYDKGLKELSR